MSNRANSWSVIIPTLNEEKTISGLLLDLVSQSMVPAEILVVDGNSTDHTQRVVQRWSKAYPAIKLVKAKSPVGAQRAAGGAKASSNLLCFLDADVRLPSDFLEKATELLKEKKLHTACPRYVPISKVTMTSSPSQLILSTLPIRLVYSFFNAIFIFGQKRYPSGAGSCIITTKSIYKKVGGFRSDVVCDDMAYIRAAATTTSPVTTAATTNATNGFGMLPLDVFVSDRRWKKYGFFPTLFTYIHLSIQFMKNNFVSPKEYVYEFGKYEQESKKIIRAE